jgi:hypothetical protein
MSMLDIVLPGILEQDCGMNDQILKTLASLFLQLDRLLKSGFTIDALTLSFLCLHLFGNFRRCYHRHAVGGRQDSRPSINRGTSRASFFWIYCLSVDNVL